MSLVSLRSRFTMRWLWNFGKASAIALQFFLIVYLLNATLHRDGSSQQIKALVSYGDRQMWSAMNKQNETFIYSRESPMIWVGGVPRSGTTLMRVMLDAHRDVRCGAETRIVPRLLSMRQQIGNQPIEQERLKEAGVTDKILDEATRAFVMEVLTRYEEPSKILCCKDPFSLRFSVYIQRIFPNSKFVLMLRDGRAVVHSIISRQVTISGYDMKDYGNCLQNWDNSIREMLRDCMRLGRTVCLPVFYELIVLKPEKYVQLITDFIGVDYDPTMLKYYEMVGEEGGIHVSKLERSTDQVKRPIYTDALIAWIKDFPRDVYMAARHRAPMLNVLGYDFDPSAANAEAKYATLEEKLERLRNSWNNDTVLGQPQFRSQMNLNLPGLPGMGMQPQQQQQQWNNRPMNVGLQIAEQLRRIEQGQAMP